MIAGLPPGIPSLGLGIIVVGVALRALAFIKRIFDTASGS